MLKGESITLFCKEKIGTDSFGKDIYELIPKKIDNVLWVYSTVDDIASSTNLFGKKAVVTLGIPKGDKHDWIDSVIEIRGRKFRTFGYPIEGIDDLIPGPWNKKVMCDIYE